MAVPSPASLQVKFASVAGVRSKHDVLVITDVPETEE